MRVRRRLHLYSAAPPAPSVAEMPGLRALAALLGAAAAAAAPVAVLPLGDSITHGCGSTAVPPQWGATCTAADGGYRYPLWAALNNGTAGRGLVYVGSVQSGPAELCGSPAGCAHEGHPGWRTDQLLQILNKTLQTTSPEVVLLHAGTNDIGQNKTLPQTLANLRTIVAWTLAYRAPGAASPPKVLLASILNMVNSFNPQWQPAVAAYNKQLPALAASFPAGAVTFVDVEGLSGLCDAPPSTLCCNCNAGAASCPPAGYDRVHPTFAGYEKMGAAWAPSLKPLLLTQ